ncbi:MAG: LysM peptidoglycan-binding domain-containing protein, partial [Anaerolineae bacterium]
MRAKLVRVVVMALLLTELFLIAGPVQADTIHVVKRGETLYAIARRYSVSVQAIVNANGLHNPNFIWVGQRLRIPCCGAPAPSPSAGYVIYVVKRCDTLAAIAWRYGVTVNAIVQANGIRNPNFIWVGQRLRIPATAPPRPAKPIVHVVQRGEILAAIAWRYGVTVWDIVAANGLRNPNFIWVGQRLIIPGAKPAAPPKPKPTKAPRPKPSATPKPTQPPAKAWAVRVVSNTNQDHPVPGPGSVLQVSVKGKTDLPVKLTLGEFYETSMPTGSKPEVGPYACEFAPLQAGTWTVTPKDLGISHDIYLDGSGLAHIEFYRTQAKQPESKPGQPAPKPQPSVGKRMKSPEYGMHAFLWWRPEVADRDLMLIRDAGFGWVKQTF